MKIIQQVRITKCTVSSREIIVPALTMHDIRLAAKNKAVLLPGSPIFWLIPGKA